MHQSHKSLHPTLPMPFDYEHPMLVCPFATLSSRSSFVYLNFLNWMISASVYWIVSQTPCEFQQSASSCEEAWTARKSFHKNLFDKQSRMSARWWYLLDNHVSIWVSGLGTVVHSLNSQSDNEDSKFHMHPSP